MVIAYHVVPAYPLIVVANRDEFLDRATEPLHHWPDAPHILAGRDLKAGGTWLGISTAGRFAALTNHRDLRRPRVPGPSRGLLVRHMLEQEHLPRTDAYEGLNILFGDRRNMQYHNNVEGVTRRLEPGVHGISNAFLNTPWPKVERAKRMIERIVRGPAPDVEELFGVLADDALAADDELPDTGIGMPWERLLSAIRIRAEGYGTRSSTVIIMDEQGKAYMEERTLDASNGRRSFELLIP